MMAAMMLPPAAPAVLAYGGGASQRGANLGATAWFAAGYLRVFAVAGLLGYAAAGGGPLRVRASGAFAWHHAGRWVAGGVLSGSHRCV